MRSLAARAGSPGGRERRELRVVRHLRGPARGVAGTGRAGRADPGDRPRRLAAGVDRYRRRDDGFQERTDRGHEGDQPMSRTARIDRETSESKIHVELDLDGTGKNQNSTDRNSTRLTTSH